MNAPSKNRLPGALGALIGLAVVAVFAFDAAPPASAVLAQPLLDYGALFRAVGELVGTGFFVALLAFGLRQSTGRIVEGYRSGQRARTVAGAGAVTITVAGVRDATASELDDEARLPGFAPVVSLTEAQVLRQRAQRQRQERSAAVERA